MPKKKKSPTKKRPAAVLKVEPAPSALPLRLDLGCGGKKQAGFTGVDILKMPGVDVVCNLGKDKWPFPNDSVEEVNCQHFLEHLTQIERCHFVNELYRVMKVGGKALIVTPHWCSNRAYGDPTHMWPPISEMFFNYLDRAWRKEQAPHTDIAWWPQGYDCNFAVTGGYSFNPLLNPKNDDYRIFAIQNYKEAALDTISTMIKNP